MQIGHFFTPVPPSIDNSTTSYIIVQEAIKLDQEILENTVPGACST